MIGTQNTRLEQHFEKPKARKSKSKTAVAARADDSLGRWAQCGVVVMAALSALLNGYANAQGARLAWAAWAMGIVVPLIVLIIGKVAGLLGKRGHKSLAYVAGATGIGLLALSVVHCSRSIALLTGTPTILAVPMAVAVDCGLVVCELALLVVL